MTQYSSREAFRFDAAGRNSNSSFTRMQNNDTNPILTEFRRYAADHGNPPRLAAHWTKGDVMWAEMCLSDYSDEPIGTPAHERHALRVLTRLANLKEES